MNYSEKIREIAKEKWGPDARMKFIGACVMEGLSNGTAEYMYDGDGSQSPFMPTKKIVEKVLKVPKETIFGSS
jgi:hypothetical protein